MMFFIARHSYRAAKKAGRSATRSSKSTKPVKISVAGVVVFSVLIAVMAVAIGAFYAWANTL